MQLIPVIDLKDGEVVHAVRGNRSAYQPIHHQSCLTKHSDAKAVLEGFFQLYPFKTFYIADINAITGDGNHQTLISSLLITYPEINFWIDDGSQFEVKKISSPNRIQVIGTESQKHLPKIKGQQCVLSLDYKGDALDDPAGWFENTAIWPNTVIAMTLKRVGSHYGPDLNTLNNLKTRHPRKRFYAAGGVRNAEDLRVLSTMGICGVLLATALHNKSITQRDIEKL